MTSSEWQALRERLGAASDGPWTVRRIHNSFESEAGDRRTHPCVRGFRVPRRLYDLAWEQVEADAEFMAFARQDIPLLVDEVEHLKATLQECQTAIAELLQRKEGPSAGDLSRVERFLAEENARWDSGDTGANKVRRLRMTPPPMRPRDAATIAAIKSRPEPLARTGSGG